MGAIMWLT